MRDALAVTFGVSLGVHALAAAALLVPRGPAPEAPSPGLEPAPLLAGETFELPAPETADAPLANASPSPDDVAPYAPSDEGDAPARVAPPRVGHPAPRASHAGRPSAGRAAPGTAVDASGAAGATTLYGAVGERSAAELATAFTRSFPQAASADPVWRSAPLGSAGEVEVVLTLDEAGHIEAVNVLGAPTPALASAIRRTLALVKGRPFVARSKTTRLHLSARISADAVHDGLHGDVFAIGGSFTGTEGSAFFALAIGRRVDLRVRAR